MPELILMVGNIGTGKTTTVRKLMADADRIENRDIIMISADDLVTVLFNGHYGPDVWTDKHWPMYAAMKLHMVREAFIHGFDIIIDGTHMNKINRKVFIDIAKEFNADVIVYLHTYPNGLKRRIDNPKSEHTSPEKWAEIHNNFADAYEEPSPDEGIDKIIKVKGINLNDKHIDC